MMNMETARRIAKEAVEKGLDGAKGKGYVNSMTNQVAEALVDETRKSAEEVAGKFAEFGIVCSLCEDMHKGECIGCGPESNGPTAEEIVDYLYRDKGEDKS